MANRTARLRREQEAYELELRQKRALRNAKTTKRLRRSSRRLQQHLGSQLKEPRQQDLLRTLLRRKSTRYTLGCDPAFFITVIHCLENGAHYRDLSSWRAPRSADPVRVFKSLSQYLLVRYPMPAVLFETAVRAVTSGNRANFPIVHWFLHVAGGNNLSRAEGLPFQFTRKAAHYLFEAPEELAMLEALRWAQVRAMGGTKATADLFAQVLGDAYGPFEQEWAAVIRFVIRHWKKGYREQALRIIGFIRSQRIEPLTINLGEFHEHVPALYPNFDIRQATEQSLMGRIATWEAHVEQAKHALGKRPFPSVRMQDSYLVKTSAGTVQIRRLRNIRELHHEGTVMRHCVGSYGGVCQEGKVSIWSVRSDLEQKPLATIELSKRKKVVQVRGKANSYPDPAVIEAVEKWSAQLDLTW
ncbi:MAG: hypothetical protein EP344_16375 [Bacteroidetes bacterium]|nr:MAG: hypothetical protein EP344_16375 [Bacteroidota bacterium]